MVRRGGSTRPQPSSDEQRAAKGVAMTARQERQDQARTGSAGVKQRAVALIAAWACIGVAAIAAALSFLF
jgi:hypothetical protein